MCCDESSHPPSPSDPRQAVADLYALARTQYQDEHAALPPPHLWPCEFHGAGDQVAVRTEQPGIIEIFVIAEQQVRHWAACPDPDPALPLSQVTPLCDLVQFPPAAIPIPKNAGKHPQNPTA